MVGLTRAYAAELAAAVGGEIGGRELGLLTQMVENRVVGAPHEHPAAHHAAPRRIRTSPPPPLRRWARRAA